jgi:hypothetical protein
MLIFLLGLKNIKLTLFIMNEKLTAITPIVESPLSLQEQRMALHEMFALAMSNIPENETDNLLQN